MIIFNNKKSLIPDNVYLKFCQDEFIKVFILRYIFCYHSYRLHRGFKVKFAIIRI